MFIVIWEYQVKPDRQDDFESFYARDGQWSDLFRKGAGYLDTELLRHEKQLQLYLTITDGIRRKTTRIFCLSGKKSTKPSTRNVKAWQSGIPDGKVECRITIIQNKMSLWKNRPSLEDVSNLRSYYLSAYTLPMTRLAINNMHSHQYNNDVETTNLLKNNVLRKGNKPTSIINMSTVEVANSTFPDLILLDIMIPGINAIQLCKIFQSTPDLKHIPIIIVSAVNDVGSKRDAFNAGARDFLSKPVRADDLAQRYKSGLSGA